MRLENPYSELIWNTIKRIMKNESSDVIFNASDGFYSITPLSIRWKNFFLNNLSWGYEGKGQKMMIRLSDKIKNLSDMIQPAIMDIKRYINEISSLNFSIYLTDWNENRREKESELQKQAKSDDSYAIILQDNNRIEEFTTTIAAKLFLMNKGYLVGGFEIPSQYSSYGLADVVGIKGDFVNKLKLNGIIPFGGDESDLLIWKDLKNKPNISNEQTETIVCEVKSSKDRSKAYRQLYERSKEHGYLKSHCFNKGFACFAALASTEDELKNMTMSAGKYEAGSIIFIKDSEPVFNDDTIYKNPSSYRKNASLSLLDNSQKQLIELANKKIARLMISNLDVSKVFDGINKMKINEIFKEIGNVKVEDVISKMINSS